MSSSRELPVDRLATTDRLGNRIYLYVADVRGRFRRARTSVFAFLILIFLCLPWLRIGGHQAVLLDIPHRRFALFGVTFWAHDAPMIFFVLAGAALTLGLVTAVFGRVWCGWACPQTVFIDGVFRRMERLIEGDWIQRRQLDQAPLSPSKLSRKSLKWLLFLTMALVISHSFLAYFVGTDELARMIRSSPFESPTSFLVMAFITGAVLFDFGWFREQFCTIVCPYGRFQSVLMDSGSMSIAYDEARGEPRKGMAAPDSGPATRSEGDCVNCYRCVQVCPAGIDIRRGLQLECIACTACVDACDDVMARLKKPLGLIRYIRPGKLLRPRVVLNSAIVLALSIGLVLTLISRSPVEMMLMRAVESPYQEIPGSNGEGEIIINHFKLDLKNQSFDTKRLKFAARAAESGAELGTVASNHRETLPAGESERADLFVKFPKSLLKSGHLPARIILSAEASEHEPAIEQVKEVSLVGPFH